MRGVAALFCAAALLISASLSSADAVSMPRTLLLANTLNIQDSHSHFIKHLRASGREVDIREANNPGLQLRDWDVWLYAELIIFAPQADGEPSDKTLLRFFINQFSKHSVVATKPLRTWSTIHGSERAHGGTTPVKL